MTPVRLEAVALGDLTGDDRIKLTYPDGTVLVGHYLQPLAEVPAGMTIIQLRLESVGVQPVDITGASIERIVVS